MSRDPTDQAQKPMKWILGGVLILLGVVFGSGILETGSAEKADRRADPPARGAAERLDPDTDPEAQAPLSADAGQREKQRAEPKPRDTTPVPTNTTVKMPDGSELAVLNGAIGANPPSWPADTEYTPPVRIQTDPDGTQYYVHENGVYWTTLIQYRPDLGRDDPGTWLWDPNNAPAGQPSRPVHPAGNVRRVGGR